MSGQLRHLARIAQKPSVTIRLVPFSKGLHIGLRGPFVLLGFDGPLDSILYLENSRRGDLLIAETKDRLAGPSVLKIEDPADEVAQYEDAFAGLMKLALDPEESLRLIDQVAEEAEQQAP
jgi:hypothetical protein